MEKKGKYTQLISNLSNNDQIVRLLPNITEEEAEEIYLFYKPEHKSIFRYDQVSLFYNACVQEALNPLVYVYTYSKDVLLRVGWIAYAFRRLDVFEELMSDSRLPEESEEFYVRELGNILSAVMEKKYEVFNKPSSLYSHLGMLMFLVSKHVVENLLDNSYKVNIHENVTRDKWRKANLDKWDTNVRDNKELIREVITNPEGSIGIIDRACLGLSNHDFEDIGGCYLFAGRIVEYVAWKRKGLDPKFRESYTLNRLLTFTINNEVPEEFINKDYALPKESDKTSCKVDMDAFLNRIVDTDGKSRRDSPSDIISHLTSILNSIKRAGSLDDLMYL